MSVPEPWRGRVPPPTYGLIELLQSPSKLARWVFGMTLRWIPQDVNETLLDPVQLLIALGLMVVHIQLAGRAWRLRGEYRAIRRLSPDFRDSAVSRLEIASIVVSVVLALAVTAAPGAIVWAARG
jgi:hypothetical protein